MERAARPALLAAILVFAAAPATAQPYLDDDVQGTAGVGMAILEIAALTTDAAGLVVMDEDEPRGDG